jgi:hypothetical protein
MCPNSFQLRRRSSGLTAGHGPVLFVLVLLSFLLLIAAQRSSSFRLRDPGEINTEADRLAWRSNWEKAGEL